MHKKMFGHMPRKKESTTQRIPGAPFGDSSSSFGEEKGNPPGYEGKEHVKYKDPGYTRHEIDYPDDEPHMKSHVSSDEEHEMEDNYHMEVPDQTHYSLEAKLKRARMKMDAPDQEDPDELRGNMVHNVGEGVEDTSGEEEEGPNMMQSEMGKEHRKKMVGAVVKRKMKKQNSNY
jgi:hypothetical protein